MSYDKMDAKMYRRMSIPFASIDQANAALNAFYEEVYELRVKHRLADVQVIVQTSASLPDDTETPLLSRYHIGDALRALPMVAYAFGHETKEHDDMMAATMSRAKRSDKK